MVDNKHEAGLDVITYSFALVHAIGLASAVAALPHELVLGQREVLGASAGFHDGDVTGLGELTRSVFIPVDLPSWA